MKEVIQQIKAILEKREECRNNDYALMFHFYQDYYNIDAYSCTLVDFLKGCHENKIPKPATITRMRRKVQTNYPHLKGNKRVIKRRRMRSDEVKEVVYG